MSDETDRIETVCASHRSPVRVISSVLMPAVAVYRMSGYVSAACVPDLEQALGARVKVASYKGQYMVMVRRG